MSEQQSELRPRGPFTGSHMLNVKNARLRSEHDVNLLRNRLERLRQEERKALKKIEETRRRADQIVSLKTRNEELLDTSCPAAACCGVAPASLR